MRITKIFAIILAVLALTALVFTLAGCNNEKPSNKPDPITTQYNVTYYDEDGTTVIETRTFTHGDRITYPNKYKEGHDTSWNLYDLDAEPEEDGENEIVTSTVTRNMKAVASYVPMDCLVCIYDSVTNEELFNQYYLYGDTYTPDIETDKPGYKFLGFSENGTDYVTEVNLTGSVSLYAMYEAIPYKITFLYDDVPGYSYQVIYAETTAYYGAMTLPTAPTVDGYTFDGWYVQNGFKDERVGGKGDTYLLTGTTTFWAVYTKNATIESDSNTTS